MGERKGLWIGLTIFVVVACGCLIMAAVIGGGAWLLLKPQSTSISNIEPTVEWNFPDAPTPVEQGDTDTPVPYGSMTDAAGAEATLKTLEEALVPNNDPRDLAERLKGISNIPETVDTPLKKYKMGDEKTFWATNVDTNENFKVDTVLGYASENAYIWVEKGLNYDRDKLFEMGEIFQNQIYPTNRKFFGSEWRPGIDGDPHVYILYIGGIGNSIAGYFSSVDSVHPLAHEYSNAHETFYLNSDNLTLGSDAHSTLAHEFQHMIHWYRDRNETSWMNEGFSVVAELLNNFDTGGFDYLFASQPDQQLTDWPNDSSATRPYYGSAFLFLTYFLDRFGDEATQALVANPDNGMDSVDNVLSELKLKDNLSGEPIAAEDLFRDWTIANYLGDANVADGRYHYGIYPGAPQVSETEEISNCSPDWSNRQVNQYGTDYIRLDCSGSFTLHFQGVEEVGVLETNPASGKYAVWSNKGDESDMTLTQTFDFSKVKGPLEIAYKTWYDIETDYDYLYIEASLDGKSWKILRTPSGTEKNPSGNSYGWGYSGVSGGWIEERVDLSDYAGEHVTLRFEYVTDAAVNGEGLLLDDISIPAVNYFTDFENDLGGWEAAGFVRIENRLPQTFLVSLIRNGNKTTVEKVTLDDSMLGSVSLDFDSDLKDAVLVVSGNTRFIRQLATYRFRFEK